MKVICDYCDSYVEIEENEVCPNCGGPLSNPITVEKTRQRLEMIELEEKVEARRQQEKAEKEQEENFELIKDIALGVAGSGLGGVIGRAVGNAIKKEIKFR